MSKSVSSIATIFILIAAVAYFAYSKGWIFAGFESITPKQASELLQEDTNITLLDVRTNEEYAREHIEGSELIPVQVLAQNLSKLPKDKKIIVYCHSGNRSVKASRILVENGYVPLNVKGGIEGWKSAGLPIEH